MLVSLELLLVLMCILCVLHTRTISGEAKSEQNFRHFLVARVCETLFCKGVQAWRTAGGGEGKRQRDKVSTNATTGKSVGRQEIPRHQARRMCKKTRAKLKAISQNFLSPRSE